MSGEKAKEDALIGVGDKPGSRSLSITTQNMIDWGDADDVVKKIVRESQLIDTAWEEIVKAKAIVDPKGYIRDRAKAIKEANTGVLAEVKEYYNELNKEVDGKLPDNKIKELLRRKLYTSSQDYYADINSKYPITNLATSLQNAITSSTMNPTEKTSVVPKAKKKQRRRRRKK